ncbi:uncharacterized protein LOC141659309 isoform X2 [Apium graveolens]|uniref:uncharacterized protein LOC141659309 isoform X2 n=1 Tax=Apium graveolens TaxID=4045 RepID=UPI003D7A2390
MKEVTYNHLLLKNFPTLQYDGGVGNQNHMSITNSQCTHGRCPVSFSKSCLECDKLETPNVSNVTHTNVKAATSNTLGYLYSTPISKLPGKSRSTIGATPPRVPFSDMTNKCPTDESKLGYLYSTPILKLSGISTSSVVETPPRVPLSDMTNKCPTPKSKLGVPPFRATLADKTQGVEFSTSTYGTRQTRFNYSHIHSSVESNNVRRFAANKRNPSDPTTSCTEDVPGMFSRIHASSEFLPSTQLFEDTNVHVDYDSIEVSTIPELQSEDSELFWDDDSKSEEMNWMADDDPQTEFVITSVPEGYSSLGPPTEFCRKCKVIMWKEERTNKNVEKGTPTFGICCGQGQIKLPSIPPTLSYLKQLYNHPNKSKTFKRNFVYIMPCLHLPPWVGR